MPSLERLHLAGLVLGGQFLGCAFAGLALTILILPASAVVPIPRSGAFVYAVFAIILFAGPVLASWGIARRVATCPSPLLVSIVSWLFAFGVFDLLARLGDGSHHAAGVFALRAVVLVPIASVLGSFMSSYLLLSAQSRAR